TGAQVPRDYTHVRDLAGLVAAVVAGPADADRIFYGATGRELQTAADVAAIVRDRVPGAIVEVGDAWTEVDRTELSMRGRYDIGNAREQLGWTPRLGELADGLDDYIAM